MFSGLSYFVYCLVFFLFCLFSFQSSFIVCMSVHIFLSCIYMCLSCFRHFLCLYDICFVLLFACVVFLQKCFSSFHVLLSAQSSFPFFSYQNLLTDSAQLEINTDPLYNSRSVSNAQVHNSCKASSKIWWCIDTSNTEMSKNEATECKSMQFSAKINRKWANICKNKPFYAYKNTCFA